MTWWKVLKVTGSGPSFATHPDGYVNSEKVSYLEPVWFETSPPGTFAFFIKVNASDLPGATYLNTGSFASEADAGEGIRKLVAGVDPSTIV